MKLSLPNGCSRAGAQMGRRNVIPVDPEAFNGTLRLQLLPFVDCCYDRWGAYWGSPANVWCAWLAEPEIYVFVRADDRDAAKARVREVLPHAKFFR